MFLTSIDQFEVILPERSEAEAGPDGKVGYLVTLPHGINLGASRIDLRVLPG